MPPFGKLYGYAENPRSRGILVAAKDSNVELEVVRSVPIEGFSEEYRKLNRLGRIPTFEGSDGFVLTEAIAIAIYVTSQNEKTTLFGTTKKDYAVIIRWMSYFNTEIQDTLGTWWKILTGRQVYDQQALETAQTKAYEALDVAEEHLASSTYLAGEQITLADYFAAGALGRAFSVVLDKAWRDEHPSITRWYKIMVNLPVFTEAVGESVFLENAVGSTPPINEPLLVG